MEWLVASALAVVTGAGVFLVLRGRTFPVIIGLSLLGYAVNFFIFAMGRLHTGAAPILTDTAGPSADPLPQALVLTAIVIGFAMTGFVVELALRAFRETSSDHVDAGRGVAGSGPIDLNPDTRDDEFGGPDPGGDVSVARLAGARPLGGKD